MKLKIVDPQIKVYGTMDENSVSIATLAKGMEVDYGAIKRKAGKMWIPVTLTTGQQGYIPGDAHVFSIREGALMQEKADVHTEPSAESLVKQELQRNAHMSILEVIPEGEQRWVHIRDMNGNEGFIDGETRIKVVRQKTKALGSKNIISGLMWLVAGGIIAFSGAPAVSGSGFTLLGYLALILGAGMLIYGVYQFFTAPA